MLQVVLENATRTPTNRALYTLVLMRECEIKMTLNESPWWARGTKVQWSKSAFRSRPAQWSPFGDRYTLYSTSEKLEVAAFTDGSTIPGSQQHSGFGIVLTTEGKVTCTKEVAGACRASGNNYLAECVGILGAVQMTPSQAALRIFTDSTAAIWAIRRAASIPQGKWLNMGARPILRAISRLLCMRTGPTFIQHVRSHTNLDDDLSRGNQRADHLANQGRVASIGTSMGWLTDGDEEVLLWRKELHVIGNVRADVKRALAETRLALWQGQPRQGRIAREVGVSILAYAAEIRKLAWKSHNPQMISFLVGSLCQVLPTRGRRNRDKPDHDRACIWCSGGVLDDSRHVFECPRRGVAAETRWAEVTGMVKQWFPDLAVCPAQPNHQVYLLTQRILRKLPAMTLDRSVCKRMAYGFLHVRPDAEAEDFEREVMAVLEDHFCTCSGDHTCQLPNCYSLDFGLQEIIRTSWHLDTEMFAGALHRNSRFHRWFSERAGDVNLGAAGNVFNKSWEGMMGYAFPPEDTQCCLDTLSKASLATETGLPTRILVLVPATEAIKQKVDSLSQATIVLEFAPDGLLLCEPDSYRLPYGQRRMVKEQRPMLLVQVENPEAAAMYPVDGKMLQDRLCGWRNRWQAGAELNHVWMASLTPHVTSVLPHTTTEEDDKAKVGVMHWFDARVPKPSQWGLQMLEHQDDVIHGKLSKLAEFDRYMGSLGIIPGAMKDLLQDLTRKPDGATDFDAVREMTRTLACKLFTSAFDDLDGAGAA